MAKKVNNTKKRLTFIDIILVLAILGLAAFAIFEVINADQHIPKDKAEQIEYVIEIEKVRYADFNILLTEENKIKSDFLLKNETVYLEQNSKEIGKIVSVEYEPYMESTGEVNESGELIYCEYPGYINILITVQTSAEKTDYGYTVSGIDLLSNSDISFRTQTYCGDGKIVSVSRKTEDKS